MSARSIQGTLAAATRHRPSEDHTELRRALKEAQLAERITRAVDSSPRLTDEQRDRLALLLRGDAA